MEYFRLRRDFLDKLVGEPKNFVLSADRVKHIEDLSVGGVHIFGLALTGIRWIPHIVTAERIINLENWIARVFTNREEFEDFCISIKSYDKEPWYEDRHTDKERFDHLLAAWEAFKNVFLFESNIEWFLFINQYNVLANLQLFSKSLKDSAEVLKGYRSCIDEELQQRTVEVKTLEERGEGASSYIHGHIISGYSISYLLTAIETFKLILGDLDLEISGLNQCLDQRKTSSLFESSDESSDGEEVIVVDGGGNVAE